MTPADRRVVVLAVAALVPIGAVAAFMDAQGWVWWQW